LREVVHHGFEQLAIETQLARSLVEQRDDLGELDARAAQRAGQHQPG
jgi:hypothetical protein